MVVPGGIGAEQRGRCQRETLGTGGRINGREGERRSGFGTGCMNTSQGARSPHSCNRPTTARTLRRGGSARGLQEEPCASRPRRRRSRRTRSQAGPPPFSFASQGLTFHRLLFVQYDNVLDALALGVRASLPWRSSSCHRPKPQLWWWPSALPSTLRRDLERSIVNTLGGRVVVFGA